MTKWLAVAFFLLICPSAYAFLPAAAIPAASSSGPAAPFVIGGIAAFTVIKKLWSNPLGELKVHLTTVYNDAQEGLEENLARYLSEPATLTAQKERLDYFDSIWDYLKKESLKTAQGIISWNERQRNGKWCWECYFRDPIANDPRLSVVITTPPQQPGVTPTTVPPPTTPYVEVPEETQSNVAQFLAVFLAIGLLIFLVRAS